MKTVSASMLNTVPSSFKPAPAVYVVFSCFKLLAYAFAASRASSAAPFASYVLARSRAVILASIAPATSSAVWAASATALTASTSDFVAYVAATSSYALILPERAASASSRAFVSAANAVERSAASTPWVSTQSCTSFNVLKVSAKSSPRRYLKDEQDNIFAHASGPGVEY